MRFISFNSFIRTLAIVSFVVGLIGGIGLIPRPARANVQPSCSNDPLFTNGTFITGEGNGAGGANTSSPPPGYQGLGFLADPTRIQSSVPSGSPTRARLADDFVVDGNGWRPSAITFYAYQTGATTPTSTITGVVDLRLWDGPPGVVTSTVIAGPVAGPITPTRSEWTQVYRTYLTPAFGETVGLTSTRRPIMAVTISWPFTVTTLLTGTYWIEWGMTGDTNFSGPWVPAVSFSPTNNNNDNNNARQLDLSNGEPGTWAPRVDYAITTDTVELPFVICGERIPTPQITSLNPAEATVGGSDFTLTVNGSGFIDGTGSDRSIVYWNGEPLDTFFSSSTVLTATVPAARIATAGWANVTVVNPGNVTSNIREFAINNPTPTISAISPFTAVAGDPGFPLTITGTGFITSSVVRWNGTDLPTSFSSSTVLTATVPAERIAAAGTANVTVFNPGPGGGESNPVTFTIQAPNPAPTISAINPTTAVAGGPGFTLTITGTGFISSSVVRWNGSDRSTTFVSSTRLTASIPASDIATAGPAYVTVFNPGPGGGTSDPVTFNIQSTNPQPTISSVTPEVIPVGNSDVALTVTGSNFVANSVVRWNGTPLTTTFVSATELRATLPAAQRGVAGDGSVTVFNPAPGGGASNAATVRVRFQVMLPLVTR
ncbi:MAG: cell shape-determining protein [Roseiflexus sp.]|nr:cell shape-determining protein [Roseiflexus sp.]